MSFLSGGAPPLRRQSVPVCAWSAQDGRHPIHYAALNGHTDCIRSLVEFGADIAAPDVVREENHRSTAAVRTTRASRLSTYECHVARLRAIRLLAPFWHHLEQTQRPADHCITAHAFCPLSL